MKLAGRLLRHADLAAHKVLFWDPKLGQRSRVDILRNDTGLEEAVYYIKRLMENRLLWHYIASRIPLTLNQVNL